MRKLEDKVSELLQPLRTFWSWLKRILYPYRYFIFALDVILIILLVVLMICSI